MLVASDTEAVAWNRKNLKKIFAPRVMTRIAPLLHNYRYPAIIRIWL